MSTVRARVVVRGQVQGVFFRASAKQEAERLGLVGWVRNAPDGSVEAAFEGAKPEVDDAVDWCRTGPAFARVETVDVFWEDPVGDRLFRIGG